jgi:DNA (cytosine-5)-methyltransferase 1
MNKLSLFSGIGGLDLAAEAAGFKTAGFVEWNEYCQKVLRKHWPKIPIISDIREVTKERLTNEGITAIKLISGGFPCQPFSTAGSQKGKDDNRYLWPEMLRVISEVKPDWVVGENVAGIINMALDRVCLDLEKEGYEVLPIVLPACSVSAKHRRERVFILGHAEHNGLPSGAVERSDAQTIQWPPQRQNQSVQSSGTGNRSLLAFPTPEPPRLTSFGPDGREIELSVCGTPYGISGRVDRLKSLGNAVVPQQAYPIFKAIAELENL